MMKFHAFHACALEALLPAACLFAWDSASAQTLPKDVTAVPFYDVAKPGLSFKVDKQSIVGMWEVPGKPQHFLVLGYFGFIWSLYPDMGKTYAPGAIKDYQKTQLADFNNITMKGWEQGALGGAFDPGFKDNGFFYTIINQYANPAHYHTGFTPTPGNGDGAGNAGLVVIDRWKLSADLKSLTRDATLLSMEHGTGYGSSNMVFGKDGMLYITTDAYNKNSWDSTDFMRKILRIDVSRPEGGRKYSIPKDNPWYAAANPKVKKEVFAFGFRNTYALTADYLTGKIWGAEVGQSNWEEINIIEAGKNYGWANGADGSKAGANSIGIEGPCSPTGGGLTSTGNDTAVTTEKAFMAGYSRTYRGRTFTCKDFTNGTWNFHHSGNDINGTATALKGTGMNCIMVSPAFRGDPTSALYGYHFVTDVARPNFIAVKVNGDGSPTKAQIVGSVPASETFSQTVANHNGITSFSEDAYGNMYITMVASSSSGAYDYHDILMLSGPSLKPLAKPREQVIPVPVKSMAKGAGGIGAAEGRFARLAIMEGGVRWITLPKTGSRAEVYGANGARLWAGRGTAGANLRLPAGIPNGSHWVRYLP